MVSDPWYLFLGRTRFGIMLLLHAPAKRGFFVALHRADFVHGAVHGAGVAGVLALQFVFQELGHVALSMYPNEWPVNPLLSC